MIQTVVDRYTGKVLYCTILESIALLENEMLLNEIATGNYYDFEKKEFYNK